METIRKERLATTTDGKFIDVELYYDRSGNNKGYFLFVAPVTIERGFASYVLYSGIKYFLMPVPRKSKKAEEKAVGMFEKGKDAFVKMVLQDCGLELAV